mgnify:CR=1 FL=1
MGEFRFFFGLVAVPGVVMLGDSFWCSFFSGGFFHSGLGRLMQSGIFIVGRSFCFLIWCVVSFFVFVLKLACERYNRNRLKTSFGRPVLGHY